jgi:KTSC domain
MEYENIESSMIASVGYQKNEQILEVTFQNQTVYEYYKVPEDMYESFLKASSKGQFMNQNIIGYSISSGSCRKISGYSE